MAEQGELVRVSAQQTDDAWQQARPPVGGDVPGMGSVRLIYWLYLVGMVLNFFMGTGLVLWLGALVWAYLTRDDDLPDWLRSHLTLQVRTFWQLLLYVLAAAGLVLMTGLLINQGLIMGEPAPHGMMVSGVVGMLAFSLLWLVLMVWMLVRCLRGLKLLGRQQGYPYSERWGF